MCWYSVAHSGQELLQAEVGQRLCIRTMHWEPTRWVVREKDLKTDRPAPVCLLDGTRVLFRPDWGMTWDRARSESHSDDIIKDAEQNRAKLAVWGETRRLAGQLRVTTHLGVVDTDTGSPFRRSIHSWTTPVPVDGASAVWT